MELMQEVKGYSDSREEELEEEEEEEEEAAEEEEEEEVTTTTKEEESSSKQQQQQQHFSSSPSPLSLSSSSSPHHLHHHHDVINNIPPHQQQQNPWLGMIHDDHHHHHNSSSSLGLLHQQDASSNLTNHQSNLKQLDFMELSLGSANKDPLPLPPPHATTTTTTTNAPSSSTASTTIEKEHMFDKVVTPSDVGKLNRLVIPKQHAEKYFPLDSSSNEKGLLLNFEDRNGKLWRFRYSYWNSSQSYVMTKGWSRFVKEKKLDAGDIVSFQRGLGDLFRHRLYIDWRRRSSNQHHHHINIINGPFDHHSSTTLFTPFFLPNQPPHPQYSIRWGGANSRLYSLNNPLHLQQQQLNYNNYHMYPFNQQQQHGGGGNQYNYHELSSGSGHGSIYYMRSAAQPPPSMPMPDIQSSFTRQQQAEGGSNISPMIIDSVPIAHHHQHQHHHQQQHGGGGSSTSPNTASKRLRLFGVNMECGSSSNDHQDPKCSNFLSSTSVTNVTMANPIPSSSSSLPHEDTLSTSTRFGNKRGEETSMLFDLDPSLQYRQ